jgi:hypothetical protein
VFNNLGTVELVACLLTNNSAVGGNGGTSSGSAANGGVGGTAFGGAIFNNGGTTRLSSVLAISNSTVGGQGGLPPAPYRGGDARGGMVCSSGGELTMTNCTIVGNSSLVGAGSTGLPPTNAAIAQGGAIFEAGGTLVLDSTELRNNMARGGDSPFGNTYQIKPGNASGGAIYAQDGSLSIVRCKITMNEANGGAAYRNSGTGEATGGAVYNQGILHVTDTRFATNRSVAGSGSSVNANGFGGGLYNANTAIVERVLFDHNLANGGNGGFFSTPGGWPGADGFGGGIFNSGALAMTNCTLALNSAQGGNPGGPNAASGSAFGGGIFATIATAALMNTTVSSNFVIPGFNHVGGGFHLGANIANTNGSVTLRNSLVAYPGRTLMRGARSPTAAITYARTVRRISAAAPASTSPIRSCFRSRTMADQRSQWHLLRAVRRLIGRLPPERLRQTSEASHGPMAQAWIWALLNWDRECPH